MYNRHQRKLQILSVLYENLENPHPQAVTIDSISTKVGLSLKETRQLLLSLGQAGEIQSDIEAERSLITNQGMNRLKMCVAGLPLH